MMSITAALLILLTTLLAPNIQAQSVEIPHTFAAGEPARAAEVNENFSALADAILMNGNGDVGGAGGWSAVAVVAESGGDYSSPLDAVTNLSHGDQWCREPGNEPSQSQPCLIVIMPGLYVVESTVQVPGLVSVIGAGAGISIISAAEGVAITLALGQTSITRGISLRDVGVENRHGDGSESIALLVNGNDVMVENVVTLATGSDTNISIRQNAANASYRWLDATAEGGIASTGIQAIASGVTLQDCAVRAADASSINRGVHPTQTSDTGGSLRMANCTVIAFGGLQTVGLNGALDGHSAYVRSSRVSATGASGNNLGIFDAGRGGSARSEIIDVVVEAGSVSDPVPSTSATAIHLDVANPSQRSSHRYERVRATASATMLSEGLRVSGDGGHNGGLRIVDTVFDGGEEATESYGIRFMDEGSVGAYPVRIDRSEMAGGSAAIRFVGPYGTTIQVGMSQFFGPVVIDGEQQIDCAAVYDAGYVFYPDACPP